MGNPTPMPATAIAPTTSIFERLKMMPAAKPQRMLILPACERSSIKLRPFDPQVPKVNPARAAPNATPIE
ncbi:MAG: hypothetical protein ABSG89_11305 [Bacteroidales bacterium]